MTGPWHAASYGDHMAGVYDEWHPPTDDTATLDTLAALANGGPVLELGVGTGRLAIPLARRGLRVHGVDASHAMVDKLRAKPGGDLVDVTVGDMADVALTGAFRLAFVADNTFFCLPSQDGQSRCMARVADALVPGGAFVLEAFVPDAAVSDTDQRVSVLRVDEDEIVLEVSRHEPLEQRVSTQRVFIAEHGIRMYPVRIRYATVAELDLMARLAGFELEQRWAGWNGEAFTPGSGTHVSVYRKPGAR